MWVGTTRGRGAEASGGAIAILLDMDELVAFARSSVTRQLSDDECREYLDQATCSAS